MPSQRDKVALIANLSQWAVRYFKIGVLLKKAEKERKVLRDGCVSALEAMGTRAADVEDGGVRLRATAYVIDKETYNVEELKKLLRAREVTGVLTMVVDEAKLMEAVVSGQVSLEDIKACATVRTTYGFRVDEIRE